MNTHPIEIVSSRPRPTQKSTPKNSVTSFSQQKIEMEQAPFFFPPGYENIFLAIYFLTLPYVMGILFLFFYIAKADSELFLSISVKSSYLFTWAIGYEVLAAIFFLFIIKLFMNSIQSSRHQGQFKPKFQRP